MSIVILLRRLFQLSNKAKKNKVELEAEKRIQQIQQERSSGAFDMNQLDSYRNIANQSGRIIERIPLDKLVPAPAEWNYFPPLSPDKELEMYFSVLENGLFSPIIVWEQPDCTYMILSGHNRVNSFRKIYEDYKDADIEKLILEAQDDETFKLADDFSLENFESIDAHIFKFDDIDENKAQEIIIDTNYIQRDEDKKILTTTIMRRLEIVKRRRDLKGKSMDIVANEMGISASGVHRQWVLATKIIDEMRNLYYDEKISQQAIMQVQNFSPDIQKWIVDEYGEVLTNKMLNRISLKKNYSKNDLKMIFDSMIEKEEVNVKTVTFKVEEEWVAEFKKAMKEWIYNKRKQSKITK